MLVSWRSARRGCCKGAGNADYSMSCAHATHKMTGTLNPWLRKYSREGKVSNRYPACQLFYLHPKQDLKEFTQCLLQQCLERQFLRVPMLVARGCTCSIAAELTPDEPKYDKLGIGTETMLTLQPHDLIKYLDFFLLEAQRGGCQDSLPVHYCNLTSRCTFSGLISKILLGEKSVVAPVTGNLVTPASLTRNTTQLRTRLLP